MNAFSRDVHFCMPLFLHHGIIRHISIDSCSKFPYIVKYSFAWHLSRCNKIDALLRSRQKADAFNKRDTPIPKVAGAMFPGLLVLPSNFLILKFRPQLFVAPKNNAIRHPRIFQDKIWRVPLL